MRTSLKTLGFTVVICTFGINNSVAASFTVNCDNAPPGAISATLASAPAGSVININGTCNDALFVNKDDITLVGNSSGNKAVVTGFFPQNRVHIDGAARTQIIGLIVENGLSGILATANASLVLTDVEARNNIIGIDIKDGSSATFTGTILSNHSQVFGLEVITGSKLTLSPGSQCTLEHSVLGAQISVNSSFFADRGSSVNASNNSGIGFSINTGSTGMLFNANLLLTNNDLDGLDVVSASNFEVDGESEVISENNGRDGLSIDNSTVNAFGFFSQVPGLPKVSSNNNGRNGILVENTSKLDIGRNASISANNNGAAGVALDDGSSGVLQRSTIFNNNGRLIPGKGDGETSDDKHRTADLVATFGSRVSFNREADNTGTVSANQIGLVLCDRSSLARGDVRCER